VFEKIDIFRENIHTPYPAFAHHFFTGASPPGFQQRKIAFGSVEGTPGFQDDGIELKTRFLGLRIDQADSTGAEQ
jgi:hypothetical protein